MGWCAQILIADRSLTSSGERTVSVSSRHWRSDAEELSNKTHTIVV